MKRLFWAAACGLGCITHWACKPTAAATAATVVEPPRFEAAAYQSEQNQAMIEKQGLSPAGEVRFSIASQKENPLNEIDKWFKDNGLTLSANVFHDGAVWQPLRKMKTVDWGTKYKTIPNGKQTLWLSHLIEQDDIVFCIYGKPANEMHEMIDFWVLVARDKASEKVKYTLDFQQFGTAPEGIHRDKDFLFQDVLWAYQEGGILYVSHAHWKYAESSKGKNAYISAIDIQHRKILWRSQPLVCNSINFAPMGRVLVSGYAFTNENSALYAIDKTSGKTVGKIELQAKSPSKKFIEYLIPKGNTLYVHAHDKAYTIQISGQ